MLVYLYIHVYIVPYVPKYDHVHISLGAHTHRNVNPAYIHTYKNHTYTHMNIHMHVHTCTYIFSQTSTHKHTYPHKHIFLPIHTQAYPRPGQWSTGWPQSWFLIVKNSKAGESIKGGPVPSHLLTTNNSHCGLQANSNYFSSAHIKTSPFRRIPLPPPILHSPASEVFVSLCPSPEHTRPS